MPSLLAELNGKVPLIRGVRAVFSPRGQHPIEDIEDIQNEGRYICSSNFYRAAEIDVDNMKLDKIPWHAVTAPAMNHVKEDSRFIRTGLPSWDPSDDEYESRVGRLNLLSSN